MADGGMGDCVMNSILSDGSVIKRNMLGKLVH